MPTTVEIIKNEQLTPDVLRIRTSKPSDFQYKVGQALKISLKNPLWEKKWSPFTMTSIPTEDFIEFVIKTYPGQQKPINELEKMELGDPICIDEVLPGLDYKGEGMFIAGGAGITPFIAIFKELIRLGKVGENRLLYANKSKADIIYEQDFKDLLGDNFINVLSEQCDINYECGHITTEIIEKYHVDKLKYFYLCGPKPMMNSVVDSLHSLQISDDHIIKQNF